MGWILIPLSLITALIFLQKDVFAATSSYIITEGIPGRPALIRGETFFSKDTTINYQSGQMILSSNPDGTGSTTVDDEMEIKVTHQDGTTSKNIFDYVSQPCLFIVSKPPQDITHLFKAGENKVSIKLYDTCGVYVWSSALYIVNTNAPDPSPSPTPTPTPKPTPEPFLDLPWDYQGKGLSFNEAAQAINSYFDHEYPLLSSGVNEPSESMGSLTNYEGKFKSDLSYSKHDGYDYGRTAKALIGDPVLAAASGEATYMNSCSPCGNAILIDHKNGYQTRYYHLQKDSLITNIPGQKVQVNKGQPIGKVGATGNVSPPGDKGAHIHFMVVQDKNKDNNFEDNLPDGVTDPFGWQSKEVDPWPTFNFNYGGQERSGNTSFYLWTNRLDNLNSTLTANGGVFKTERYTLNFPQDITSQSLNLNIQSSPIVNISDNLSSIGSTIIAIATDALGNLVTQFEQLFTISVDFSQFDLSRYKTNTISFYSSSDGINWSKEDTIVDLTNKTATTQVNHMTYFALMAERADTTPPTTTVILNGQQGQPNWFRSNVELSLNAQDNDGGLGVDYTMYRIGEADWEIYTNPLTFSNEGFYKIEFYSSDKDENIEEIKSLEFNIDKTSPEAKIFIDQDKQDLVVEGIDNNLYAVEKQGNPNGKNKDDAIFVISDSSGNILSLDVRDRDKDKKDEFRIYSLTYNLNTAIVLADNKFKVSYKDKKDKFNVNEQTFEIEKEIKIKIKYDNKKNQSTISTKEDKEEKIKEVKDGLILLQLKTNQGKLEYSY